MNKKQKNNFKFFGALAFLTVGVSLVSSMLFGSQPAYAWCDDGDTVDDLCAAQNYTSIADADKRGVTFEQYQGMVSSCTKGNPSGWQAGNKVDEGDCANAAASCIQKSIKLDKCTSDSMAEMAFTADCNYGKLTSNSSNCDRLKDMNEAAFKELEDGYLDKAASSCTVSGDAVEQFNQRKACKDAATKASQACSVPKQYNSGKTYSQYKFDEYKTCLDNTMRASAKDDKECTSRGGTWLENDTNGVKRGCHLYSDLTNKEACDAGGGEFKANAQGVYTCVKPGTNGNGGPASTTPSSPGAANPPVNPGDCGSAKTVLIPSGKGGTDIEGCKPDSDGKGGMDALIGIVKFIISVLNIGVGVLGVGGIVYASILYASARDNASQTQQAIGIIRNVVVGILLYIFMVAILNWLLPGGVLQ